MSSDHTDPTADTANPSARPVEANGTAGEPPSQKDPVRERFRLRTQCAKLRHWCRGLLDAQATVGVLSPDVERELRETLPEISMDEMFAALRVISQGEPLPSGAASLTGDPTKLAVERERLRKLFFTLYDAAFGWDEITEEYLMEQRDSGPSVLLSDVIAQFERELGANP